MKNYRSELDKIKEFSNCRCLTPNKPHPNYDYFYNPRTGINFTVPKIIPSKEDANDVLRCGMIIERL